MITDASNIELLQRLQLVADEQECWTLLADVLRECCGNIAIRRQSGPPWFQTGHAPIPVAAVTISGHEFVLCVERECGEDLGLPLSLTVTHFLNERSARVAREQRELVSEATRRLAHDLRGDVSALSDLAMVILSADDKASVSLEEYRNAIEETERGAFARLEQVGLLSHVMRHDSEAAPLSIALEYAAAKGGVALEMSESQARAAVSGKVLHEIMNALLAAAKRLPADKLALEPHPDGWAIELRSDSVRGRARESWAGLGAAELSLTGVVVTTFGGRTWLERDAGKLSALGFTLPPA